MLNQKPQEPGQAQVSSSTPGSESGQTNSSETTKGPEAVSKNSFIKQFFKIPDKLPGWLKFKPASKKEWIIGGSVMAVLLIAGSTGAVLLYKKVSKPKLSPPQNVIAAPEPPKPTTEASRLTGVEIPIELNKRPVFGVMIENSPDARPQAGLKDAGVVFEAIAEGGITRFIALFMESQPDHIGPVRSVRPYYLDFLMPFDGAIVHAGGSAQGLQDIVTFGLKDLNHNSSAFKRVNNRFAPHNLYTNFPALDEYAKSKGHNESNFKSWPRKEETPAATPTAKAIDLNVSSVNYNVHYDYDAESNSYKRILGGKPHIDEKSNAQIMPKVVVAIITPRTQSGIYSVYQTTGSGTVLVFQDGIVTKGTWSKAGRKEQFEFKDEAGKILGLNPGQAWVTYLHAENAVTYTP